MSILFRSFKSKSLHIPKRSLSTQNPVENLLDTLKTVKETPPLDPQFTTISQTLIKSASKTLRNSIDKTLISTLSPTTLDLILSDPRLKLSKCFTFFMLLLENQTLLSFKLDLQTHLFLLIRLVKARKFSEVETILSLILIGENYRYPFHNFASSIRILCDNPKIVSKLFNLIFKVYSDNSMWDEALEVFDHMDNNRIEINERTCTLHLVHLRKCDCLEMAVEFFHRMIDSVIDISVYSMTVVVDGLCKYGEIKRGRELVEEMSGKGIKPNVITCNTLVDACCKRWNFGELGLVLALMEKEGVEFNAST